MGNDVLYRFRNVAQRVLCLVQDADEFAGVVVELVANLFCGAERLAGYFYLTQGYLMLLSK